MTIIPTGTIIDAYEAAKDLRENQCILLVLSLCLMERLRNYF